MKIVLIGAGNLATNIGVALAGAGHELLQVYSKTEQSAEKLAAMLHCPWTTELKEVNDGADVYIIAVKDGVLADVAQQLAAEHDERFLVHTAGSMPIETLPTNRRGVLYPMQTFSKERIVDFKHIPCFVEAANEKDGELLRVLAETLSESVYEANSEARKFLHLSAVFCCNFANHCYALAEKLLQEHGGLPFEVMLPLIDETAKKVHELSPKKAQTGPAVRWDTNVMEKHMQLLKDNPQLQEIYRLLSESVREGQKTITNNHYK